MAHLVKNPPAMWETWAQLELGRSLGEGNGYLLQYSYLENSMDRRAWVATVHGVHKESDMTEHAHTHMHKVVMRIQGDLK